MLVPKVLLNCQQMLEYHPSFYEQNENKAISLIPKTNLILVNGISLVLICFV